MPENELMSKAKKAKFGSIIIYIVAIVLIAVIFAASIYFSGSTSVKYTDDYYAVFLSNGQVYFSKVDKQARDFTILSDIYYLRVQRALQPGAEGEQPQEQQSISLVKLGSELHGPQDKMIINNEHILFIEELKEDSKVVVAIDKDKEEKANAEADAETME